MGPVSESDNKLIVWNQRNSYSIASNPMSTGFEELTLTVPALEQWLLLPYSCYHGLIYVNGNSALI